MSRKYRASPRWTASDTIAQRARTASALNSAAASLAEGTTFRAAKIAWVGYAGGREISGSFFRFDFDHCIKRYQSIGDRELLHHLDPLRLERLTFDIRHRDPAVNPADAEPVENIGHQL